MALIEELIGPLTLGLRACMAFGVSLTIWAICGSAFIRAIEQLSFGQPIRTDGPQSHQIKQGIPTMGGLLIVLATVVATLLFAELTWVLWSVLGVLVGFAAIGLVDDWQKVRHQNTKGISAKQKMLLLTLVGGGAIALWFLNTTQPSHLWLPIFNSHWAIGLGVLPLAWCVVVGASNAVNLTDGLDGLAILPVMLCALVFGIVAYCADLPNQQWLSHVGYTPALAEITVFCGALIGSGIGFLWFNGHPAQIFMGDVGSLSLGGTLGMIAVILRLELVFLVVAGVFVMETLSVILQVGSFKLTGKRLFKMAPIHHHFELAGWPETKVITRFWILALLLACCGIWMLV